MARTNKMTEVILDCILFKRFIGEKPVESHVEGAEGACLGTAPDKWGRENEWLAQRSCKEEHDLGSDRDKDERGTEVIEMKLFTL